MTGRIGNFYNLVKGLLSLTEAALFFALFTVINFVYQYIISGSLFQAIIIGIVGGLICFYSITVLNEKTVRYQKQLRELNKYASSTVFKMKSGLNVSDSIGSVKDTVDEDIQEDIEITLEYLEENQDISTDHFKKYNFHAIDIFHQILSIKYIFGGNVGNLFNRVLKDMAFEIKHRDELDRDKDRIASQIYMMIMMVAAIPLILYFMVGELYVLFIESALGPLIALIFHLIILINLYFFQKEKCDISIH